MLPPGSNDRIEVLEDDLTHLAAQSWRAVVPEFLNNIEIVRMNPALALGITFQCVYMHRLAALVRLEMESPTLYVENGWHQSAIFIIGG